MSHLVLAFYLVGLVAGTVSLTQTLMIWQRWRKAVIRHYALFLLGSWLILFGFLVDTYAGITGTADTVAARGVTWILQAAGGVLLVVVCPRLFMALAGRSQTRVARILLFGLDAVVVAAALVNLAAPRVTAVAWGLAAALFGTIAWSISYIAVRLRSIGEPTLRRALAIFLGLSAAFFPLMLLDVAMSFVPFLSALSFMNSLAQPVYFLALNCLTVVFGLRYLNRPGFSERGKLTEYFLSTFGVTAREEQIIGLLLEGAGAKEIGQKLFISAKTAENHVYNIYRKLGIQSRVQMFQLIRTNELV
jgi:DNA-binding CsgD family transcriptional regulator